MVAHLKQFFHFKMPMPEAKEKFVSAPIIKLEYTMAHKDNIPCDDGSFL